MCGLNWGATPLEQAAQMPRDAVMSNPSVRADRALTIHAPPHVLYAWLCQLRVAPYSYDLLDNFGRRSPRRRDPALRSLAPGQRFMTLFTLASYVDDEHITLRSKSAAVTYAVRSEASGSRLRVRVLFAGPRALARLLAVGDVVMMRKQLLTLKALAEDN